MPSSDIRSERSRSAVVERPSTPDGFVPLLVCNWPRVVIRDVRVVLPQLSYESQPTVRACIHLGALLPVDVRVSLVPTEDSVPDPKQARSMWSAEAYHNGSYLFECRVPTAALAGGRFRIRVTPAADLPAWRDIFRAIEATVPRGTLVPDLAGVPRAD